MVIPCRYRYTKAMTLTFRLSKSNGKVSWSVQ